MFVRVTIMVLRVAVVLALIMGIIFWTGNLLNLTMIHMALGLIVVLALWVLAGAMAFSKQANWGMAITAFILGLIVLFVGLQQRFWLIGSMHWIIQVLHLLLGLSAAAVGETIGRRLKAAPAPAKA